MAAEIKLERREAGFYVTEDGEHAIIRTEGWEGPRGGSYCRWELADKDRYHGFVLDGYGGFRTLKLAKAEREGRVANA